MTPIESQGLESSPVPPGAAALTQREILRFYYPLALSWIFMALEAPIAGGIMGRLPEAKLNLAAWYVLFGLALWVESPVIDLLATSTTLSKNRLHYLALTRFTWTLALWVTAIHALLALTPLYGVVMQLMNASPQLAEQGRVAFAIMIPWSALIGWRRYRQGILIRHGHTRLVGIGTAVRVATVAGSGLLFFYFSSLPGTQVAALALICSVGAEALFAHFASRRQVHALLAKSGPEDEPLTTSRLLAFHLPLTATTMVTTAGFPLIAFALNQTRDSVLSLAAWNVAMALLFMMRAITFALTEVVITLARDDHSERQLTRFCLRVGLATTAFLLALALSGADRWYFETIIGAPAEIANAAHVGFVAGALTPMIGAMQSFVRGLLTARHMTQARLVAVIAGMVVMGAVLAIGLLARLPGVMVAALAVSVSMAAELGVLLLALRQTGRAARSSE